MISFRCGNGSQLAPVANGLDSYETHDKLSLPLRRERRLPSLCFRVRPTVQPFAPERHFLAHALPYHFDSVIAGKATVGESTACNYPNPETMVERAGEWKAQGGVQRPALLKECRSNARASAQAQRYSACLGEHGPSDLCAAKRRRDTLYLSLSKALWQQGALRLGSSLPSV